MLQSALRRTHFLNHVNAAITSCVRMCDRFVYDVDLVYHDVRAPPKDYNRLDRHSRTVSFVHSHVRSSLAYIFSGAAQGACALRVTVGHCSMSDVSLTSFHECHNLTPHASDVTSAPR